MVYQTCRRWLKDTADVEDVVQETFFRLSRDAGRIRGNVAAWLHVCASNLCVDLVRRAVARRRREWSWHQEHDARDTAWREVLPELDAALTELSADRRDLVVRHFLMGVTQRELAQEAGVSAPAMNRRLHQAVASLRERLRSRGVTSPAAAITGAMVAEQTAAAVPASFTAGLVKTGLVGPGRRWAWGGMKWSGVLAVLLIIGFASWSWWAARPVAPPVPAPSPSAPRFEALTFNNPRPMPLGDTLKEILAVYEAATAYRNHVFLETTRSQARWDDASGRWETSEQMAHSRSWFEQSTFQRVRIDYDPLMLPTTDPDKPLLTERSIQVFDGQATLKLHYITVRRDNNYVVKLFEQEAEGDWRLKEFNPWRDDTGLARLPLGYDNTLVLLLHRTRTWSASRIDEKFDPVFEALRVEEQGRELICLRIKPDYTGRRFNQVFGFRMNDQVHAMGWLLDPDRGFALVCGYAHWLTRSPDGEPVEREYRHEAQRYHTLEAGVQTPTRLTSTSRSVKDGRSAIWSRRITDIQRLAYFDPSDADAVFGLADIDYIGLTFDGPKRRYDSPSLGPDIVYHQTPVGPAGPVRWPGWVRNIGWPSALN